MKSFDVFISIFFIFSFIVCGLSIVHGWDREIIDNAMSGNVLKYIESIDNSTTGTEKIKIANMICKESYSVEGTIYSKLYLKSIIDWDYLVNKCKLELLTYN